MDDREFEKLVKSIDTEVMPPEGLKEKLFVKAIALEYKAEPALTPVERFVYEKPLRIACVVSLTISGSLWAAMGSGFTKLLSSIIG